MIYKNILKPIFFRFDPETAHHLTFKLAKVVLNIPGVSQMTRSIFNVNNRKLEREVFGLRFSNPVGLAAGLDKNAELVDEFSNFGFGFIEIGTVTPKPQPGNPRPRLFRLKKDHALINRMGFNNEGAEVIAKRLKERNSSILIGGNIGKNKVTPNDEAVRDYELGFETLFDHVDYFVVNVSSPNTPNLRELQEKEPLKKILNRLQERNNIKKKAKPILLKIAPDLTDNQLLDIIEIVQETRIAGIIATNTTISRSGLLEEQSNLEGIGNGGLSGRPVRDRSTEVIRFLKEKSNNAFPVIGVGGIHSAHDAIEKINAGADLVQVYTGFIYEGPSLIKKINKGILKSLSNS